MATKTFNPQYPNLVGKKLAEHRAKDFAAMTKAERRAYGDAVEKAIRALQHREMLTCHNRIDPTPAVKKYAAAMAAKRNQFAIPADCSIPDFLKRAA